MIHRDFATRFINELKNLNNSGKIKIAGSYRRELTLLNDLDILWVSKGDKWDIPNPFDLLILPGKIIESNKGAKHKMTTVLYENKKIKCDMYAVDKLELPYALIHSTGDRGSNLGLRRIAMDKGWLMNQYGLWYRNRPNVRVAGSLVKSEKEVFELLGKKYKPPKFRSHFDHDQNSNS